jgi:putative nucleotidyltransferase with HDIG domain
LRGERGQRELQPQARRFWVTLLTLTAILFSAFLFPVAQLFIPPSAPKVGDIANDDIVATFDFPVLKSAEDLERERQQAIAMSPAVLIYDQEIVDSVYQNLRHLLQVTDSLQQRNRRANRIADKLNLLYPDMSRSALTRLAQADSLPEVNALLFSALREQYYIGVAPDSDLVPEEHRLVAVRKPGGDFNSAANLVLSLDAVQQNVRDDYEGLLLADSTDAQFIGEIAASLLRPNLEFSPLETERKRELALGAIEPEEVEFKAGQRLIAKNQRITEAHRKWLMAMAQQRSGRGIEAGFWQYLLPILARVLFIAFVYLTFLALFFQFRGAAEFRVSRILPLLVILVSTLVVVYLGSQEWGLSLYLLPTAAGVLLAVILYDLRIAMLVTMTLSLLLGILFNFNFEIALFTMVAGTTVSFSMREVQKRSYFYRATIYLALALAASAFILESLKFTEADEIWRQCGFAVGNAVLATVITMVLLPIFEFLFSFTTDVTLLELSDLNRPLLKRLALEAPGTYQHSLVVGNLAEAAAKEIGANPLLARVGAYYHDIGKIAISEYFVENQFGIKSKHEELAPSMSALVIGSHIKRGVELAEEANLPDRMVEFIEEHHGTSTMTYFYHKAKEQTDGSEEVSEAEYRYPGPRPRSKETAIMMIADTVEAASRTLDDPKPSRIRSLIRRLMNDKFQTGQLSDSSLTLADLKKIEDAFVKVLIGIFHARIDYPTDETEVSR